jgi:hypothetical protein
MKRKSLQIKKSETGSAQSSIVDRKSDAKKFFADKVFLEASFQGALLSAPEQYVLLSSEGASDFQADPSMDEAFYKETNSEDFERKICGLLKSAFARDKKIGPETAKNWRNAFLLLDKDYDYIRTLVGKAIPRLERPLSQELRDLALYVPIALALVGAIFLYAIYIPPDADLRWYGLAACSISIFGFALFASKDYFRLPRFWLTFIGVLIVHSLLWIRELSRHVNWELLQLFFVSMYEGVGVVVLLHLVGEGKLKAIKDLWR